MNWIKELMKDSKEQEKLNKGGEDIDKGCKIWK